MKPIWMRSDEIPSDAKAVGLGRCQMAYEEYCASLPEQERPRTVEDDNKLRSCFLAGVRYSEGRRGILLTDTVHETGGSY